MKKKLTLITLLIFYSSFGFSQEKKIDLYAGVSYLPEIGLNNSFSQIHGVNLYAKYSFNFELCIPTKNKHFEILAGSMVILNSYSASQINGGGVYSGLKTILGNNTFGFELNLAAGILSFKNEINTFNESYEDIYEIKSTHGLGSMSSIGFYLKGEKIGIAPNFRIINSGSDNYSLTLIGFNLPIVFRIKYAD